MSDDNSDLHQAFLPAGLVWKRYGVTQMTLWRWIRHYDLNFPAPIYIGRVRYWRVSDLERWEAERPTRQPAARNKAVVDASA